MKPKPKPIRITKHSYRHVHFLAAPGVDVTPLADYGELKQRGTEGNVTVWVLRISEVYRVNDVVQYMRHYGRETEGAGMG